MQTTFDFDTKEIKKAILFLTYDEILQYHPDLQYLNGKNIKEDIIIKLILDHLGIISSMMKEADTFTYRLEYLELPGIVNGDKVMLEIITAILENEGNKVTEIKSMDDVQYPLKAYRLAIISEKGAK